MYDEEFFFFIIISIHFQYDTELHAFASILVVGSNPTGAIFFNLFTFDTFTQINCLFIAKHILLLYIDIYILDKK